MLDRIEISGFRTCDAVTLDGLGKVTALIGRNSAGKSNVLQAIQAMARLATASGPEASVWSDVPSIIKGQRDDGRGLSFRADVTFGAHRYRYSVRRVSADPF